MDRKYIENKIKETEEQIGKLLTVKIDCPYESRKRDDFVGSLESTLFKYEEELKRSSRVIDTIELIARVKRSNP